MNKIVKEIIIGLIIILSVGAIYTISQNRKPCEVQNISIAYDSNDSRIAVSEKIMEQYLKPYKEKTTCPNSWITTFKINSVQTNGFGTQEDNQFTVNIDYSVKPEKSKSSFWLKNGEQLDSNGWLNNKQMTINIVRDGDLFKLVK